MSYAPDEPEPDDLKGRIALLEKRLDGVVIAGIFLTIASVIAMIFAIQH